MGCSAATALALAGTKSIFRGAAQRRNLERLKSATGAGWRKPPLNTPGKPDLLKQLIQWCSEHNFTGASAAEIRREALQLHTSRIFDNPQWVGYLPFNKRYRPEIWDAANIVFVRMKCCPKPGAVTQEQIDRSYMGQIACPHCGRWNTFTILGYLSGSGSTSGPIPRSDCELNAKHSISGKDADANDTDSPWEDDD